MISRLSRKNSGLRSRGSTDHGTEKERSQEIALPLTRPSVRANDRVQYKIFVRLKPEYDRTKVRPAHDAAFVPTTRFSASRKPRPITHHRPRQFKVLRLEN